MIDLDTRGAPEAASPLDYDGYETFCNEQCASQRTGNFIPTMVLERREELRQQQLSILKFDDADFNTHEDQEFAELMKENDDLMCRIEQLAHSTQEHISKADRVLRSTEPGFFSKMFPKLSANSARYFPGMSGLPESATGLTSSAGAPTGLADSGSAFVAGQLQPANRRRRFLKRLTSWLRGSQLGGDFPIRSYSSRHAPSSRKSWKWPSGGSSLARADDLRLGRNLISSPYDDHLKLCTPIIMKSHSYRRSHSMGTLQSKHFYDKVRRGMLFYNSRKKARPSRPSDLQEKDTRKSGEDYGSASSYKAYGNLITT
ncbi:ADL368Wp [Eremothecium gossypii ATCC 10895]|uniref:ADL368Wp n=1 Tax=Eremothecium gossypii (strain ATCC 10895 / CBS 109.51 / FGSC 9923 / NRRL Y-1056) TaxID=284811 RepID=Q75BD4_EREGS|nr:ADL368Wp [Eremothecium gossypii ATCC 10895]AAS51552.1 ADL368Wp [Eremothecium gossypii ATCC 10895]AEY95848.1 FADL368Wp [Eremothecium gossypii FDAG1]